MEVYVTGGRQREGVPKSGEKVPYERGVILRVDLDSRVPATVVEYVSPAEVCADDPSISFTGGSVADGVLHTCTETELLLYELPSFKLLDHLSLPCFNDVHHTFRTGRGTMLIANTGLDMVLEVDLRTRSVLRQWNVLGGNAWGRFSPEVDYRKVSTKPHQSHPNHVFELSDDVWVTRLRQKDLFCLTNPGKRIEIEVGFPHDGLLVGHRAYFTTVDGHIVVANVMTQDVEEVVDLNEISRATDRYSNQALGWCRGLLVLDDDHILVGFTRLRPTRWRENVQWVKRTVGVQAGAAPTRIALYDLRRRELAWELNLEDAGMNALFSILAAS